MKQDSSSSPASADGLHGRARPAVPNHEMLRLIGHGSYGEVWMARHTVLNTYRAVKVVYRDRFLEDRPFERELEGIQRFEHCFCFCTVLHCDFLVTPCLAVMQTRGILLEIPPQIQRVPAVSLPQRAGRSTG